MAQDRVICLIDGFNLYHAIVKFRSDHLKWLDLWSLADCFVHQRSEQLVAVYYFSAHADWLPSKAARHRIYVEALRARGVTPIIASFKRKDRGCPSCGHHWIGHEEKETDVDIGLYLLNGAHKNEYDRAMLLSRDSDLAPAFRMVKQEFPRKQLTSLAPPNRGHSTELLQYADSKAKIRRPHIERCLLPATVHNHGSGVVVTRPSEYDPPQRSP